jgi:hypothetical protein
MAGAMALLGERRGASNEYWRIVVQCRGIFYPSMMSLANLLYYRAPASRNTHGTSLAASTLEVKITCVAAAKHAKMGTQVRV